jgi:hypothetical protein
MTGLRADSLACQPTLQLAWATALAALDAAGLARPAVSAVAFVEAVNSLGFVDLKVGQRAGYFEPGQKQTLPSRLQFRDWPARRF